MSVLLVRFPLGSYHCGLPVGDVTEVLPIVAVTRLPSAPAFLEGVINLRGAIIPIMDLRKRFGLSPGPFEARNRILIVSIQGRAAGLIVDEVGGVESLTEEAGLDLSKSLGFRRNYVSRVLKEEGELVMVLDLGKILSPQEREEFDASHPAGSQEPQKKGA